MKVYISIPIAQRNFAANVAKLLAKFGHEPLNPFCNGLPEDAPRAKHMRKDLRMLLRCNAIVLCPGWKYSEGCLLECSVAKQCGMAIAYADLPIDELARQLNAPCQWPPQSTPRPICPISPIKKMNSTHCGTCRHFTDEDARGFGWCCQYGMTVRCDTNHNCKHHNKKTSNNEQKID